MALHSSRRSENHGGKQPPCVSIYCKPDGSKSSDIGGSGSESVHTWGLLSTEPFYSCFQSGAVPRRWLLGSSL